MTEPIWLRYEDCLAFHEILIARFGGSSGIRQPESLQSAIDRVKNLHAFENASIPKMAASIASGIIGNHPFVDGNKRTGFVAAITFLEHNGFEFYADEVDAYKFTYSLAAGELSEDQYAEFLTKYSREAKRRETS
jgi:death-on-curing protein